jgi:DNA-binding beta-propeller fold protein YncE
MAPVTVGTGSRPYTVAVDPSGRYAYVPNNASGNISQFAIGPTGGLTPMAIPTVVTGSLSTSIAVDAGGHFVYVTNSGGDAISQYKIGASGGLIPMLPAMLPTGPGGIQPQFITTWSKIQ